VKRGCGESRRNLTKRLLLLPLAYRFVVTFVVIVFVAAAALLRSVVHEVAHARGALRIALRSACTGRFPARR
jgi:hypothetical protein